MATGAPPFDMSPRSALVAMIREQPYVPARQLVPGLPLELEGILATLLAKNPADRYQSARELHDDLGTIHTRPAAAVHQAQTGIDRGSLAVLPFEIVGGAGEEIERFRDGLTEDVATQLGALPGLRVAPRTSVRSLAGLSIDEIGQRLAVARVLEGSIQHAGDRVRVTANLVDAAQQRSVVPPLRIDCRREERFAMQDAVAREICDGLTLALSRAPSRYTPEPDAAHAFKRGRHHWHHCFSGGWRRAIEHFEYAIDRDPQFADAHVALANAYNFVGFYCLMKPRLSFSVAARSADRALAIDSGLASAHRERALATFGGEWDWSASEAAFRMALALDPDDALAHVYYSWLLILLGREDAALAEAQRAQALAPSSRLVATARAQTLYIGERYEEALEICRECLRTDPAYLFAVHLSGLCQLALSGGVGAVAELERAATISNRVPYYLGLLGRCYGQCGLRTEALALVDELQRQSRDTYVAPQCYVYIYAGLQEREQALAYQESAYLDGAPPFNYLAPTIRDLYALDPYHKSRLEQMRLAL
jgi:TolB-like protein/tetratricopeptide (TPR) repeat protein